MSELHLPKDYQDLLQEFIEAGVDFLLIGGWAVAVHGHPRATDDIDLLVQPTPENASRVYHVMVSTSKRLLPRQSWWMRKG